ncbi:primosomal protein N' [Pseudoxanthomonas helianthi]|uniref:Replication restart protein PriA n=1 Tax=Pseudoxanthomonas helianthi TaxID=1453541 RepID=A0A940X225_9GAMM|nr:primosomal protein N' [Pseudoxanthomonas helianthi]MBP3983647.1 primosomal protein N' [Pseudoxanthomonas helianthi]
MPPSASTLQVALPVPLPRVFDYRPPADLVAGEDAIGRRVRVPFGPRELCGVVAGVGAPHVEPKPVDAPELRHALALLDEAPLFHGELLESLRWLARYTHAPLGEVFATALPAALRHGEPLPDTHAWAWTLTPEGSREVERLRKGTRPRRLAELLQAGPRDEDALDLLLEDWRSAARALAKRGLAERVAVPASRIAPEPQAGPELNAEQQAAVETIVAADGFAPVLLEGVTGSGKTEVYLRAIADCLARGKQALVLVPEIGLTPQTLARFRARLGVPVHALHSGLNDNARARTWAAAWRGEARVIVGTRSAVFTPLPDAGLIVVDEEHDASYKQQDGIRYHARDFALVRGKALGVPVLLGSATPSLESLHNAQSGRYTHLRLSKRAGEAKPPAVRVVDVRKRPLQAGLSPETLQAIDHALHVGGQVLVFKNRRGYAPALLCHDCGWSAHCKRCDATMTVHAGGRRLQCHHCGHRQPAPLACPDCGGLALQPQGIGTERLEEMLAEKFAAFPVVRVDRGTTQRKDAMERHLDALGDAPGILVGTQILAKGHDLPHLTLVVVVGVDEGLFSADFRAGEKLAQQLIQVAGRAGRAEKAGEVWLQTHHPEHALLQTLIHGGYPAFAANELAMREAAGFPPFAHLALLRAEAQHVEAAQAFLLAAKAQIPLGPPFAKGEAIAASAVRNATGISPPLKKGGPGGFVSEVELHGPMPAPMPRRAGFQRMQLLLSSPNRRTLHAALDAWVPALHELPEARKVRWSLDVDPVDLY